MSVSNTSKQHLTLPEIVLLYDDSKMNGITQTFHAHIWYRPAPSALNVDIPFKLSFEFENWLVNDDQKHIVVSHKEIDAGMT